MLLIKLMFAFEKDFLFLFSYSIFRFPIANEGYGIFEDSIRQNPKVKLIKIEISLVLYN